MRSVKKKITPQIINDCLSTSCDLKYIAWVTNLVVPCSLTGMINSPALTRLALENVRTFDPMKPKDHTTNNAKPRVRDTYRGTLIPFMSVVLPGILRDVLRNPIPSAYLNRVKSSSLIALKCFAFPLI
jgi:hypothetical protein